MSTISNQSNYQSPPQATSSKEPLSLGQIMALVDETEGKLAMVGAREGQVAETASNAQTALAMNYKQTISDYISKAKVLATFTLAATVTSSIAGVGAGAGAQGLSEAGNEMSTVAEGIKDVATATATIGNGAASIGESVTCKQKAESESNETLSSGALNLAQGDNDELTSETGAVLKFSSSGKSAIASLLSNENAASKYQG